MKMMQEKYSGAMANVSELNKSIKTILTKISEKELAIKILEEDNNNFRELMGSNCSVSQTEAMEGITKYRKLLRCTACDKRYKDTVINKCMHVFCSECLEIRLETRNRKCPNCGESFSKLDLKKIFYEL